MIAFILQETRPRVGRGGGWLVSGDGWPPSPLPLPPPAASVYVVNGMPGENNDTDRYRSMENR